MNKIEIKHVTKCFGESIALSDAVLNFEENKIYGLLGRNGAGKSTLLNIICNRLFATSGEVLVDGKIATENDAAQEKIYMMSEKTYYPPTLTIRKIINYTKSFYPNFDEQFAYSMARKFNLDINKQVRALSTGYCSIFKLVIALSVNTPYLLLDEPVLGLDANHRELFYHILLQKYIDNPCTIVVSTHLIEEISNIVEDIIIIKNGAIITNESRDSLMSKGYTVSGSIKNVDEYIIGKNVIGVDIIGGLKSAHILGNRDAKIPANLDITSLDLQKLFIQLTNA